MHEAASNRAAIANLHVTDLCRSFRQQRAFFAEKVRSSDLRVSGQCADSDAVAFVSNVIHAAEPADVNDVARRGEPQLHHREKALAAREYFGFITMAPKKTQGLVKGLWGFVFKGCGNHRAPRDFAAPLEPGPLVFC